MALNTVKDCAVHDQARLARTTQQAKHNDAGTPQVRWEGVSAAFVGDHLRGNVHGRSSSVWGTTRSACSLHSVTAIPTTYRSCKRLVFLSRTFDTPKSATLSSASDRHA